MFALWAHTKRKDIWKEACPWHMSNLHPHKKVNTLQGCTDTSCWLSFLLQLYGRCNSYRHHPPVSLNRELSPFWKLSAHIQYLQNTSTSKRPYKGADEMMENYMPLTLSAGFLLSLLLFQHRAETVLIFNETRLIMPVNSLCEEHVSAVNRIAHGLSVSDWWMCSWACVAGQRLRGWGSAAQFPLRSHKTSTSEDTAAERCRPPAAILLNPPRTRTSLTSPFPSHMLSKHFSVH